MEGRCLTCLRMVVALTAAVSMAAVHASTIDEFAPVPPFPLSDLATRVHVAAVSAGGPELHAGDTWPTAWAPDGTAYVAGCDNKVKINGVKTKVGLDFFALRGSPEAPASLALTLQSAFPVPAGFCDRQANQSFAGTNSIKAAGVVAFEDESGSSVLVMGVQCQNYGDHPSFNRQHNVDAWLLHSTSGGKTWTNGTTPHSLTGRYASPCFLQQGKGNNLSDDGYVYMYFPAAVDGNAYWCQNDGMLLARARPADLFNYSRWQVVVDLKLTGRPAVGGPGREVTPEWADNPFVVGGAVAPPGGQQAARVAPADLAVPVFVYPLMVRSPHFSLPPTCLPLQQPELLPRSGSSAGDASDAHACRLPLLRRARTVR
jgi:hypothetical protein